MTNHLTAAEIAQMRAYCIDRGAVEFWGIAHRVCDFAGIKVARITGSDRGDLVALLCRNMICRIASDRGLSGYAISKLLGRDPGTIRHAIAQTHLEEPKLMFRSVRGVGK